ncbi:hypothetical protein PtrM4_074530 [Pyrenophora tritici-repentis]|uniref:Uncharacterized protein n=1 Tax=Pyrenophora tritici-repentis TaxID=45151 RepID=A0A834RYL8_9PLEO|nr:hypothetical protein PtrM4_074530 [Pyrenophora tritici-repentis]KAI1507481.1 hypothetical protein Ptr86124_013585 [Pyrenophora tritici-repentis]KAI1684553.1 hypothetical protein KJE20_04837 [Pyrenophora tritici-repentis]
MIQTFSLEICGDPVSMSWVERFLHRNQDRLISRWAPALDRVRQLSHPRLALDGTYSADTETPLYDSESWLPYPDV